MSRIATSLPTLLFPLFAWAQWPMVHYFVAQEEISPASVKRAYEAVHALDPNTVLSADGKRLKVRVDAGLSVPEVRDALHAAGLACTLDATPGRHALPGMKGFPVRVDTGDPTADEARYQIAKRAWAEANPEAYQRLTAPAEDAGPGQAKDR